MKKILILMLALMNVSMMFGQQKVAIYVTGGGDAGIKKVLGDQLTAAIAKSGKYIAIERTSSFLAELNKEQNYQHNTGAVDDNELSRLGKQFGVQLVCVAEISDVFGEKYISTRLIDVESAEVVNTSNASSKLENMQELLKTTEKLTTELTGETVKEKAAKITKENAEKVAKAAKENAAKNAKEEARKAGYVIVGNLAVQIAVSGNVDWGTANATAKSSTIGGFTNWRLPTIGELSFIYANKFEIWGHGNIFWTRYSNVLDDSKGAWSSDICEGGHQLLLGYQGTNYCSTNLNLSKKGTVHVVAISVRSMGK